MIVVFKGFSSLQNVAKLFSPVFLVRLSFRPYSSANVTKCSKMHYEWCWAPVHSSPLALWLCAAGTTLPVHTLLCYFHEGDGEKRVLPDLTPGVAHPPTSVTLQLGSQPASSPHHRKSRATLFPFSYDPRRIKSPLKKCTRIARKKEKFNLLYACFQWGAGVDKRLGQ